MYRIINPVFTLLAVSIGASCWSPRYSCEGRAQVSSQVGVALGGGSSSFQELMSGDSLMVGFDLESRGLHDEALAVYNRLIAQDPGDYRAYEYKVDALLSLGRYTEAADVFASPQYVRSAGTLNVFQLRHVAQAFMADGRFSQALVVIDQGIAECSESESKVLVELLVRKAAILLEAGNNDEAIAAAEQSLKLSKSLGLPHSRTSALLVKACAYRREYRVDKALECIVSAVNEDWVFWDHFSRAIASGRTSLVLQY